jgi:hypothetical protein
LGLDMVEVEAADEAHAIRVATRRHSGLGLADIYPMPQAITRRS